MTSGNFNLLDYRALQFIQTRSLLLAKSINKTTLDSLRVILADGFEKGESIKVLSKRIEGYFSENEKYRADMTARTEVITASNQGANDRYQAENVKEVEWLSSPDSCAECLELDGQIFPIDSGPRPCLHPNCSCGILPVIE
jgi:SPP1 gp7 family putative phage head morphogenesis protein